MDTLLIVDDSVEIIDQLIASLRQTFRIRVALNGAGALRQIQLEPPDLVLLDIHLPDMDGFEVCKRLKNNLDTRHIPVVFHSSDTNPLIREYSEIVGSAGFIHKPSPPKLLHDQLTAVCRKAKKSELPGFSMMLAF